MQSKRKILVICALGYATSTMIKKTIEDFLKEKGISGWKVDAVGLNMSEGPVKDAAVIVSSLELNPKDYAVPIVNGISLISGINKEGALKEILELVQKAEAANGGKEEGYDYQKNVVRACAAADHNRGRNK